MQGNSSYSDKRKSNELENRTVGSRPSYPSDVSPIGKQGGYEGNPYLKKHTSHDENILTFNEKAMKISSPSGYSPVSKKEILEQDEYQTEPRVRE